MPTRLPQPARPSILLASLACALSFSSAMAAPTPNAQPPQTSARKASNASAQPASATTATTPTIPTATDAGKAIAPSSYTYAIVVQDQVPLRNAARDAGQQQALLTAGDWVEMRGERLDYVQVYDHLRERGGFVKTSSLRRTNFAAAEAPELLAVLRYLRDANGPDALGIGMAAAYLKAAPTEQLLGPNGAEAMDALAGFAEHLARRASASTNTSSSSILPQPKDAVLWAHLDVAARYGVRFTSFTVDGRIQQCYDGEAYRRVLSLPSTPLQQARAVLALTRDDCISPDLSPADRRRQDDWRAEVLDHVDVATLPALWRNRVLVRRASVQSRLTFARARSGESSETSAAQALDALALTVRADMTDDDAPAYNDAAMRVNASRWALTPALPSASAAGRNSAKGLRLEATAGEPGQTCLNVVDDTHTSQNPLARQCTYSQVWLNSSTINREANALAVAVQPTDSWCELWVARKDARGWTWNVLAPSNSTPEIGYAEFAGWVPGGQQILVARESRSEGKYRKSFEVVRLDTLSTERQSADANALGPFQRWQDPAWKRLTVAVR